MQKAIKVYMSHAIRGAYGAEAPEIIQEMYCNTAKMIAEQIRAVCEAMGMPPADLQLYIPAEHEEFKRIVIDSNLLTIDEVIEVDCTILKSYDICVVYVPDGDELQGGRLIEHDFAVENMKNICVFGEAGEAAAFIVENYEYAIGGGVAMDQQDHDHDEEEEE